MNKEMKEIKEQMKICKVSSKYINDIKIKICDFNLVINTDEKLGNQHIQIQRKNLGLCGKSFYQDVNKTKIVSTTL